MCFLPNSYYREFERGSPTERPVTTTAPATRAQPLKNQVADADACRCDLDDQASTRVRPAPQSRNDLA